VHGSREATAMNHHLKKQKCLIFVTWLILFNALCAVTGCGFLSENSTIPSTSHAQRQGSYIYLANLAKYHRSMHWPVERHIIDSQFGDRRGRFHEGLDLRGSRGDIIRSAHSGKVVFSGFKNGYGRTIVVQSGPIETVYAHTRRNLIGRSRMVRRGQRIAEVGASGKVTGPHLHFEVRVKTRQGRFVAVNPTYFLG
jgi:murein DD-endopeptidase MepM/ murein hydrolase activator NlpD